MHSHPALGPDASVPEVSANEAVSGGRVARILERCCVGCLFLFVFAAPHSIAATQAAFIAGCVLWIARMVASRRLLFARTAVDLPLALFLGWTVLSVATSLDPAFSADRLRGVSLFFAMYLFASNIPSRRVAWALTLVLSISVVGNLALTYYQRYQGSGLKIVAVRTDALSKWGLQQNDTIVAVDGKPVRTIEDLNSAFDVGKKKDLTTIKFTRGEYELETSYRRNRVRRDGIGPERLGIDVAPGRDFRSRGFFSHPSTYAEVLQLIASVISAWVIVGIGRDRRVAIAMAVLGLAVAGALIQTQTRAPIASFGLAIVCMLVVHGAGRKAVVAGVLAAIVVVSLGALVMLRGRSIDFFSPTDDSTAWRLTVWREALPILAAHPIFGIGPDAAKEKAGDLNLFEGGKLPPGHFHSTPMQIAVDRGVPALLGWLWFVVAFFVAGARLVRKLVRTDSAELDWRVTAAALGAWGAWVGFIASSLVHFNWGDGEPMELAWALMGILFAISRLVTVEVPAAELR